MFTKQQRRLLSINLFCTICFLRECEAKSRLHQTLYLRMDGRLKNIGCLSSSSDV